MELNAETRMPPGVGHPRADVGPVEVGGAGGRLDADAGLDVGILDRVHVDGQPVGVHRPLRRPLGVGVPAVEAGGVVRGHGLRVTSVEDIDRFHPADREPGPVQDGEDLDHLTHHAGVDDDLPGVHPAVEARVGQVNGA